MFTDLFRSALTLCFCLIFNAATGQFHQLLDSLTAPNLDWEGDTAWMQFSSDGLRSSAPTAGSFEWRRESRAAIHGNWSLKMRMDFNPSTANFCSFRFIESDLSHYAIQLSGSSGDDLSLILQTPERDSVLAAVSGYVNRNDVVVALRIERDSNYTFHVYDAYTLLFSASDSTIRSSKSLSLQCTYTSSRVDKFFFSTLRAEGYAFRDTIAPKLQNIDVLSPQQLRLNWSETTLPAPGSLNGIILRSPQGIPVDSSFYPYLGPSYWDVFFDLPIPLGRWSIEVPLAIDTAGNLTFFATDSVLLSYPDRQSVQIIGIHQIEGNDGDFFIAYSPVPMPEAQLELITRSGIKKTIPCPLDSGTIRYGNGQSVRVLPGFSLPNEGVLVLRNEGIPVAVQPYDFPYAPHQSFGDFILRADSMSYTNTQWRVVPTTDHISGPIPTKKLPKNPPNGLFWDENGTNYVQFSHSLYSYLHLLSPQLQAQWTTDAPFLLPIIQAALPPLLGDSSLHLLPAEFPDSGKVFFNEVHAAPDQLEEFIELASTSHRPIRVDPLRILKTTAAGTSAYPFYDALPAFCALQLPLFPLLAPHQLRAFSSPTSLPNDTTTLLLQGTGAQTFDEMTYSPWVAPLEHRSWERISLQSPGYAPSNWAPHHARWCCPSEASPDAPNSVASANPGVPLSACLKRSHLSFDLNHYLPSTELWVSMAAGDLLSIRLLDRSGRPITQWHSMEGIAGNNPIGIGPYLWDEKHLSTGIYSIQIQLKNASSQQLKNLPISIYNP